MASFRRHFKCTQVDTALALEDQMTTFDFEERTSEAPRFGKMFHRLVATEYKLYLKEGK